MKLGVIKNKNGRIKKNKVRMKGDIEKKIKNNKWTCGETCTT